MLKNFERMAACFASEPKIKKIRGAEIDKAEDYFIAPN